MTANKQPNAIPPPHSLHNPASTLPRNLSSTPMPPADASSAHAVPQPDICPNATIAPMDHHLPRPSDSNAPDALLCCLAQPSRSVGDCTQPSSSVGNSTQASFSVGDSTQASLSVGNSTQVSLPVGSSSLPSPSVGNLGRDRKRKAEDDDDGPEERRVRSASAL